MKWLENDSKIVQSQSDESVNTNQEIDSPPVIEVAAEHKTAQLTIISKDEPKSPLTKVSNTRQKADKERDFHYRGSQRISTRGSKTRQSPEDTLDRLHQKRSQTSTKHIVPKAIAKPKETRVTTSSPIPNKLTRRQSREDYYLREDHQEREKKQRLLKRDKENQNQIRRSEKKRKRSISPPQLSNGVGDLREKLKRKRTKQEPTPETHHTPVDKSKTPKIELNSSSYEELLIEEDLLELDYDEPFINSRNPPTDTPSSPKPPPSTNDSTTTKNGEITSADGDLDTNNTLGESAPPTEDKLPLCIEKSTSNSNETESLKTPTDTENELEDGEIEEGEIEDGEIEEELDALSSSSSISQQVPVVSEEPTKITCHSKEHKSRPRLQPTRHSSPPPRTHNKQDYHSRDRRKLTDGRSHNVRRRSSRHTDNDLYSRRGSRRH